jgi:hypothetical protein
MTTMEIGYLVIVLGSFAAFCGGLAWAVAYTHKKVR